MKILFEISWVNIIVVVGALSGRSMSSNPIAVGSQFESQMLLHEEGRIFSAWNKFGDACEIATATVPSENCWDFREILIKI